MASSETQRYISTCDLPFTFPCILFSTTSPVRLLCLLLPKANYTGPPTSLKIPSINSSAFLTAAAYFQRFFSSSITVTHSPVKQMIRLFNAPMNFLLHLLCLLSLPDTVCLCFASSVTLSSSFPFFPLLFAFLASPLFVCPFCSSWWGKLLSDQGIKPRLCSPASPVC